MLMAGEELGLGAHTYTSSPEAAAAEVTISLRKPHQTD